MRELNRSVAKKLYEKFSRKWREDLRDRGVYGKPNQMKRPTFNQWYKIHEKDINMMSQSNPKDYRDYVQHLYAEQIRENFPQIEMNNSDSSNESERGVVTMNIAGDEED